MILPLLAGIILQQQVSYEPMATTVAHSTRHLDHYEMLSRPNRTAGWRCRCSNQSHCSPLRSTSSAKGASTEVFAYYENDGLEGLQQLFTDSVVTTVAVCEGHWNDSPGWQRSLILPDEQLCYAHERGVRVVIGCVGCDVWSANTQRCPGHTASTQYNFSNATARVEYVSRLASIVHDYGYDGVSLDMEGGIAKAQQNGLTTLVHEIRDALPKQAQLSFAATCFPLVENHHTHRNYSAYGYDWSALAEATDFFFPMCYDLDQFFSPTPGPASSVAPLPQIAEAMRTYPGVPPHKLVLGLPWYGRDFRCLSNNSSQMNCNATAKQTLSFFEAEALLDGSAERVQANNVSITTTRRLNSTASSPYFNYRDHANDAIHQVWFEDAHSLGLKYSAARQLGLRGVGFWVASGRWPDNAPATETGLKAMWDSVKINFVQPKV